MPNLPDTLKDSRDNIEAYVRQQLQIARLEMVEKAANLSAAFVNTVVFLVLGSSFFLLLNLGLSLFLNDVMESTFAGFFIVAGVYLATGFVLFLLRKPLFTTPIQDLVVQELLNDDDPQKDKPDGAEKN